VLLGEAPLGVKGLRGPCQVALARHDHAAELGEELLREDERADARPGEAEITAATFPSKGRGSTRLHQSMAFMRRGAGLALYSGDATRSPW